MGNFIQKFTGFLAFLLVLSVNSGNAQTNVSGNITSNTTWSKANSPYVLTGSIGISNSTTLTIEAGVEVIRNGDFTILINGVLTSIGTISDSIKFTSNVNSPSNYFIDFQKTNLTNSRLNFVKYSNSKSGNVPFLRIGNESEGNESSPKNSGDLILDNSSFSGTYLLTKGYSTTANLRIKNSIISGSYLMGAYPRTEPIIIENTTISNSTLNSDSYNYGITLKYCVNNSNSFLMGCCGANFTLENSKFIDCNFGGRGDYGQLDITKSVFINTPINYPSSTVNLTSSVFKSDKNNLTVSGSGFGSSMSGIEALISIGGGTISNTNISSSFYYGLKFNSGNSNIVNSTFSNSPSSIYFSNFSAINLNNINFSNIKDYFLYNNSTKPLTISNSYFNGLSGINISGKIFDYNNDLNKGVITFNDNQVIKIINTPISYVSNILKTIVDGRVLLTWSANTESDVSGYKIYYGGYTGYSYTNVIDAGNVLTYTLPAGVSIDEDIAVTAYDASKDGTDDQFDGNESWYSPANNMPEAPTNLAAYASGHKIKLNWDVSTSPGVNNYNIYRSTDGSTFTKLISTTNNTYTNTGLTGYIKYYYKVAAFDSLDLSYDNYGLESALTSSVNGTATNKFYVDSATGNDATGIGSSESPYKKITTAVNAAIAGDTVLVAKGTYLDNIILTKELTIIALSTQANTILKPLLPNSQIVNFTSGSNSSKLSGFTLTGGGNVRGSAIDCNFSSPTIEKCIITNSGGEAPIRYYYSDAVINNCLIYKNTGSSVFFYDPISVAPKVNQTTIVYNSGIGTGSSNTSVIPVFTNCIIYGNTGGTYGGNINILNSVIQGVYPGNETNVNANPKFIDSLINDYRLQDYSPAIGLGTAITSITKDFEGNNKPLPAGSEPDAGAYENIFDHPAPFIDTDSSRNGVILLKMTQTPAGTVNKLNIYKGLTAAPTTKYKDTTLVSKYSDSLNSIFNKVIFYRMTSIGASNLESGYSNEVRTISFTPPSLNFPIDLSIKADTNINFQWEKIDNATKYKIQYSTDPNFVNEVIELTKNDTFHLKNNLVDNTTYFWRLQTLDSVHYSKWSNFKKFQTFVRKPNLSTITTVNRVVTINWSVNSLRNIKAFKIYRGTETNPTTKLDSISSASLTYNDSVTNGVKYYYRVTAVNSDDIESDYSNELFANSFGTTLLDSPSSDKVKEILKPTFKWQSIEFATKYNIQISTNPLFTSSQILDTVTSLTSLYFEKGLIDNTTYYWRVRVGDNKGYGNWADKFTFQTYVLAPNLLSVSPSNKIDTLNWSVISSNNIKYFKIYRDTISDPTIILDSISGAFRTYIDTINLKLNKKYYYKIIIGNNQNIESDFSNILSATPFNTLPRTILLSNKTFNNVGEFNFVRSNYSAVGSIDPDGKIVDYKWFVNDSLVNATDSILIYYFNQGSNKVKLVISDNDGGKDSSNAIVSLSSFVKTFEGGFLGGITALSPNIIYTADTTYNPINGASISKLDRSGNTVYPLVVSSKIFTTPSISSDSSVFITSGSSLNGFNKSGAPLWSTIPLGGLSYVTPTIDSLFNRIYVGVSNKNFFAIDYKTGKVVWNLIGDAPVNASAIITGDRKLVFTSQAGTLYGFDIRTNVVQTAPKWSTNFGEVITKSPAVDAKNNLIIGTESGKVLKVTLNDDGTVGRTWSISINSSIQSSPVIDADGFIYVGNTTGDFYKLNPDNGAVVWKYATGAAIKSTPTISEFGNIYISNINGVITALTTDKKLKWTYQADGPISANMLYISNMLYIGTERGKFLAIYDNPVTNTVNTGLSMNLDKNRLKTYSHGSLASSSSLNIKEEYGYYYDAFKKGNFDFTLIDNVIAKEPVWGTFQGNYRRTGSKTFECPEVPVLKIPNCVERADSIKITTSSLTNRYWIVNDVVLDKITDTALYVKSTDKFKLMAYNANGCNVYSSDPVLITNSSIVKPKIITNSGTTKFCEGDSILLSSDITATKYQWNYLTSPVASATARNLSTSLQGAYSVTAINEYGCKATSDISLILTTPKPVVSSIDGVNSLCLGASTKLTNTTLGGVWSSDAESIVKVDASGNISSVAAGFGIIKYTITLNGCSNTSKINIKVNELPKAPIASNVDLCIGGTSTALVANALGGHSLLWYGTNANGGQSSGSSPIPSTNFLGNVDYYVSQSNNSTSCESTRTKVTVSVGPAPATPIITREASGNLISSAPNSNQWYKNGVEIIGAISRTYKPLEAANYSVKIQGACVSSMSSSYYFLVTDVINLSSTEFIKLVPNPFINFVNIDFVIKGYQRMNIDVFSAATGAKVATRIAVTAGSRLTFNELNPGIYFVRVASPDMKVSHQFKMVKL
jgi:outer membrane protein assembly factor BamB/fibronectin type 3 domain-containing protein